MRKAGLPPAFLEAVFLELSAPRHPPTKVTPARLADTLETLGSVCRLARASVVAGMGQLLRVPFGASSSALRGDPPRPTRVPHPVHWSRLMEEEKVAGELAGEGWQVLLIRGGHSASTPPRLSPSFGASPLG